MSKMQDELSILARYLLGKVDASKLWPHYENYILTKGFPTVNQARFSKMLSQHALKSPWRLKLVDVWTSLFDKTSLLQQQLNLITALAECDGEIYTHMSRISRHRVINFFYLVGHTANLLASLLAACVYVPLLAAQFKYRGEPMTFNCKNVLITGASQGLGRELALQVAAQGGNVVAVARNEEKLLSLKQQINDDVEAGGCEMFACDLSDEEATKNTMATVLRTFPKLDVIILNAGLKHQAQTDFSFHRVVDTFKVNLFGNLYCLEAIMPGLLQNNVGSLVFVSSLGDAHGIQNSHGYNASKAALTNFAESLRMDLQQAGKNIDVTVVKPGLVKTAMLPKGKLADVLSINSEGAAKLIVQGIAQRKKLISFPFSLRFMTKVIAHLPFSLRAKILAGSKD